MFIRPLIYPLMLLVAWLLGQVGRASEPAAPRKDVQIEVNVRILAINEEMGESFRHLATFTAPKDNCKRSGARTAMLTAEQNGHWISLFQQGRSTAILATPRIMTLSERPAHFEVGAPFKLPGGETKLHGLSMKLTPRPAGDGSSIEIDAAVEFSSVTKVPGSRPSADKGGEAQEFKARGLEEKLESVVLDEVLTIPAGKTVACSLGKVMFEVRTEHCSVPLLAHIPYVSRLVRNPGYGREAREIFVLLNARVVGESRSAR